jgi:hypothetical protein
MTGRAPTTSAEERMADRQLAKVYALVVLSMMVASTAFAQDAKPPLRNSDVVDLVKAA